MKGSVEKGNGSAKNITRICQRDRARVTKTCSGDTLSRVRKGGKDVPRRNREGPTRKEQVLTGGPRED